MDKTLKLIGRSSHEIYLLRYPSALLNFCDYDLSYFAKKAVEACSEAQKTGEVDFDRFAELRREIQTSHCYIEHHIRTVYEKIPIDCYIDYLCRRDSIGTGTLWNRYVSCRTPFEKMIFQRLCEFRYNRAINEWLNILRVKDYALSKTDFVFTNEVRSAAEAAARRNYFDLMFSVTASEMGCRLDELGQTKVFSIGRLPNAPFMFPTISKDIMRNVLADFDYSDDYSDIKDYSGISDEIAMDAFSRMKNGLVSELSSYNIIRSKMEKYDKIFMPCSFKAVIDLEIDAIIESGGYLAVCQKCGRRYYRSAEYDEDYCSYLHNGKSCLDVYLEENPPKRMTEELEEKSRIVTDEVYSRVGSSMSTKEYENWYSYMTAMKGKVQTGEISPEEFSDFLDYSLKVDISLSKPIVEVPKQNSGTGKERVVKPFVPERIDRSSLKAQPSAEEPEEAGFPEFEQITELSNPQKKQNKDGFFVSPTVARRSSERRISHIIRAGEPRGEESYDSHPNPADFRPFGAFQSGEDPKKTEPVREKKRVKNFEQTASEQMLPELKPPQQNPRETKIYEESYFGEDFGKEEKPKDVHEERDDSFESQLLAELEALREKSEQKQQTGEFRSFDDETEESEVMSSRPKVKPSLKTTAKNEEKDEPALEEESAQKPVQRTRVIKKNAAAISAYGKMAGAPVISQPPEMDVISRANSDEGFQENPSRIKQADIAPDPEPFKNIDSIFDVLENSEQGNVKKRRSRSESRTVSDTQSETKSERPERRRSAKQSFETDLGEPEPEWSEQEGFESEYEPEYEPEAAPRKTSRQRSARNEEKASADERSELDMLKAKKQHVKSNKTKRLVDAIMREPDNNPNFRNK